MPEADVDALYQQARAAWPGVELPQEAFAQWLKGREPGHAEELYLACACVKGLPQAHAAFEARYFGQLGALGRFGSDTFIDDVKQELRQRLFFGAGGAPKLLEYGGRGGLTQWVRAVATRVALNLKRSRHDERFESLDGDEGLFELPLDEAGPELQHMKELYRAEFKKAFAEGLQSLALEARTYLRQYYLDGLGLAQLAKLYGSSAPTMSRRLSAARTELLEATRTRLAERLAVSATELESIMRLIESRLSAEALTA